MSENLAAFYIGLNFIKDFDEKEKNIVYTVGTLQSLVSCYLGKNVIYGWMDSMFENHKFLYKNGGGNSQSKWGKITASCSPQIFKNNMLALADNVLIFEKEQVPAFKDSVINNAVNLQFGKRGSSIYLTNLKGYVLTTNKKNSYLAVIPAENVIFAVFFQMKTSPSIDLNTFEIRVFITPEKNVIAKIQKVNGIETIEASMTHALQLQYYKVKMNEASIQNPKKVRNSMGFLISGNQSIPFSNKGIVSKTIAKPTKAVNNQETDEGEIYQSDDSMDEIVVTETNSANKESTKEKKKEKANEKPKPAGKNSPKDLDEEQMKLAAYFVGLYFIKEYNKDKNKKVQISTDTLKGIVCEAIGQNVDYKSLSKMFENHKYLFKNMGCSSKCTWGNVTSACSMTDFPVYLLALADNAIIVDVDGSMGQNELKSKPTLEWGSRRKNYYLFKIRGLVMELPKKKNYLAMLPIDNVFCCFYFLVEEIIQNIDIGMVDVDVGICLNSQKNLIVRVLEVDRKVTEDATNFYAPPLQYYKDGISCAGLLIQSQTRNSKGFLITKQSFVSEKKKPESIAKVPELSNLSKDNAIEEHDQSQQVNQRKTDIAETESDEIYQSDESPSPTFVEETNAVENTEAGTENDLVPHICENFAANTNDMNKTIEENIVEDDIVVIPEDANANNTAPVQETDPLNNPDIGMRSDETVGATSTQGSKKKPNRDKNSNCDILVYEREVLIALQTCELSLTKPVNLPNECIVKENYYVEEQPKKLNPPPDYVVDNRIVQIKLLQNEEKNLRKRILKLQSELGGNVPVIHSKEPNRETNANEGNSIITEANNETDKNNCTVEDIPATTTESDTATIEVVEDNSGLNLPSNTYKTCTGNKISVTQTIIECLDWKEVSSTEVEGVKEIEVEIRGKLKIKSSQEVLAMKDLRTDVILNLNN